ncbi:MAG TPA: hypothetical protein VMP01_13740 [Pirellulaceae bacterium]|nr:hypothetical protein [Pirellulaceae bacterium]
MRWTLAAGLGLALLCPYDADADEAASAPLPTPLTRPEMKQALEDLKERKTRISLPELTEEDKAKLGDRADSYEGRLRYHYLPGGEEPRGGSRAGRGGGGFSRQSDPEMTLSYEFKTMLFWIVSRTNNCLY